MSSLIIDLNGRGVLDALKCFLTRGVTACHRNRRGYGPKGRGEDHAPGCHGGAGRKRHTHTSPKHQGNGSTRRRCQRLHWSPEVSISAHIRAACWLLFNFVTMPSQTAFILSLVLSPTSTPPNSFTSLRVLLQCRVDVDCSDTDGWTPLHAAAHWGQEEVCSLLVDNMCDMGAVNNVVRARRTSFPSVVQSVIGALACAITDHCGCPCRDKHL